MMTTHESLVLYLSLADLAAAVYDERVTPEDLKRASFCFVYDDRAVWESGVQAVHELLRNHCILVTDRVEKTYHILKVALAKAEHKGRLVWKNTTCDDPWAELNRMLVRQGFKAIQTNRSYNYWSVTDEVKKLQLPLRAVRVPDY